MSRNIVVVLLALSVACAAQKPQQQQKPGAKGEAQYSSEGQVKPKGVMRCHMEQETGSNRMERVCAYEDDKSDQGDSALDDALIRARQRAAQHQDPGQNAGGH